jgi:hypothetical protein
VGRRPKHAPSTPVPPTRPHLPQFYHLPIVCSNFESINGFIHAWRQNAHDQSLPHLWTLLTQGTKPSAREPFMGTLHIQTVTYMYLYIWYVTYIRFNLRIGLCDYEDTESHSLLSASWRPKKASGIIQSKCEGLRTEESKSPNIRSANAQGREKMDSPAQDRASSSFLHFLVLFQPSRLRGCPSSFIQSTNSNTDLS